MPPRPPSPQPLDVDGVVAVTVGTGAWVLAFLVLLLVRDELAAEDREWWLWTCLTGAGLGLVGLAYCLRRRAAIRSSPRRASEEAARTLREPLS